MSVPFPPPQNTATGVPLVQIAGGGDSTYSFTPLGYQQLTSFATATSLTVPTGATSAVITVEGAAGLVRYRDDGVAPTTTVGMPVQTGATIQYSGPLASIQFIQAVSGSILNVSYYK